MKWLEYRKFTYALSAALLLLALLPLLLGKLEFGIEFTGGVRWELAGNLQEQTQDSDAARSTIETTLQEANLEYQDIELSSDQVVIYLSDLSLEAEEQTLQDLNTNLGAELQEVRLQRIGPTFGQALMIKTIIAIVLAAGATLLYITFQFSNWRFGVAAVMAMLHDSFILVGIFGWLSWLAGIEVDILMITAVLTTLSFSLHDTIVMFDRIRELQSHNRGDEPINLANQAITQTMNRSLNNSLTIIFMLLALVLLGGDSLRWFVFALLSGTILGTYSSPFVAVPLYIDIQQKK